MSGIAFVAIGKNEGERLKRCIASLQRESSRVVYVDSGSTDGSVEFAEAAGVRVLPLDTSRKFNMSRARNAGLQAAINEWGDLRYVHFIDGDCELIPEWVGAAEAFLDGRSDVVAACGRRRERFPERSVFNRLCEVEWNTPPGEAKACGGDALYRVDALERVGGFDESLIAGEEPELCMRLRHAGGKIWRIDRDMTRHDANITRVSQWWKRHERAGYAAADVSRRTAIATGGREVLFKDKLRSPLIWVCGTIAVLLAGALTFSPVFFCGALAVVFLLHCAQAVRIARGIRPRCPDLRTSLEYGFWTMLAKWPLTLGILRCWADRSRNRQAEVIDYKSGA